LNKDRSFCHQSGLKPKSPQRSFIKPSKKETTIKKRQKTIIKPTSRNVQELPASGEKGNKTERHIQKKARNLNIMTVSQKIIEDDVFIPPEETELNFTYYDREIRAT